MGNERGIVLPLTLIVMVVLTSLTLALLSLSAFEPLISRNLADTTQARFAAEAGLEWAFDRVAGTRNWDTLLAGADPRVGVTLAAGRSIGVLPPARGTFTVLLRNDTQVQDPAITGVSPVEASATHDQNGVLIVTSTGNAGTAVKSVRAVVKRLVIPPGLLPGALNFPGTEAEVTFSGNSFEIDGRGWHTDGTLDPGCADIFGISVSKVLPAGNPGANEATVEAALARIQKDNVQGKRQDPAQPGQGDNTIAPDPVLTPQLVQGFIETLKQAADITLESRQPSGLSFNNIGASCATDPGSQTCWGTADSPKIVYVKGEPDPSSQFSALQLSGNTDGYGILVVEDGDVRISGNFSWHGLIIVTGKWVGIGYLGGGNQVVYGGVISNETASDPGFREGVVTGNAKIRYSCEALAQAMTARKLTTIGNWKDLAPGE